jgi:hypothetical protein
MKKLIITAAFILLAGVTFGQTLKKGNVISAHTLEITLNPDVTMNQYMDIVKNKAIPAFEKAFPGTKMFLLKGFRGEKDNGYSWLWIFESRESHLKYWNDDGEATELGQSSMDKVNPVMEELNKLGEWPTKYTDWVVL